MESQKAEVSVVSLRIWPDLAPILGLNYHTHLSYGAWPNPYNLQRIPTENQCEPDGFF